MNVEKSYLDQLKPQSQYHFDNTRRDQPGEWFTVHGQFSGNWNNELDTVKQSTMPLSWHNISSLSNTSLALPGPERTARVHSQELDIIRGGGNPKLELTDIEPNAVKFPVFSHMVEFFALDRVNSRIHVQKTGQVFNLHLDTYQVGWPGVPAENLIRFIVMLEDWCPGHFYAYGTHTYTHWRAGEFHSFRWQDIPHCTANASNTLRTSLLVTGIKTSRTEEIVRSTNILHGV